MLALCPGAGVSFIFALTGFSFMLRMYIIYYIILCGIGSVVLYAGLSVPWGITTPPLVALSSVVLQTQTYVCVCACSLVVIVFDFLTDGLQHSCRGPLQWLTCPR